MREGNEIFRSKFQTTVSLKGTNLFKLIVDNRGCHLHLLDSLKQRFKHENFIVPEKQVRVETFPNLKGLELEIFTCCFKGFR